MLLVLKHISHLLESNRRFIKKRKTDIERTSVSVTNTQYIVLQDKCMGRKGSKFTIDTYTLIYLKVKPLLLGFADFYAIQQYSDDFLINTVQVYDMNKNLVLPWLCKC